MAFLRAARHTNRQRFGRRLWAKPFGPSLWAKAFGPRFCQVFFVIFWRSCEGAIIPYGSLERRMRPCLVAGDDRVDDVRVLAAPAYSPGVGGLAQHHGQAPKTEAQKPKVDDKGYNAALARIPNAGQEIRPRRKQTVREAGHFG